MKGCKRSELLPSLVALARGCTPARMPSMDRGTPETSRLDERRGTGFLGKLT
jgi:hypothetical protein